MSAEVNTFRAFSYGGHQVQELPEGLVGIAGDLNFKTGESHYYAVGHKNCCGETTRIYKVTLSDNGYDVNRIDGFFRKLGDRLVPWYRSSFSRNTSNYLTHVRETATANSQEVVYEPSETSAYPEEGNAIETGLVDAPATITEENIATTISLLQEGLLSKESCTETELAAILKQAEIPGLYLELQTGHT